MGLSTFDQAMAALGNAYRRDRVRVLGLRPATISTVAELRGLSLPAIHKHVAVLEHAGLISRQKVSRHNVLTLNSRGLKDLQDWLAQFTTWWGAEGATRENYRPHLDSTEPESTA